MVTGFLVQHAGHELTFFALRLIAASAAFRFVRKMPETGPPRGRAGAG
jgi:hypothetical protein